MLTWNLERKSTCINFQEVTKWSLCWLWNICKRAKSLDDFGNVEAYFLDQIEQEFENQLDQYVELVGMENFDF